MNSNADTETIEAEDGVLPSTPFCTLLTYIGKAKTPVTSAAILGYVKCQVENCNIVAPDAKTLVQCTHTTVIGQFMSFIRFDAQKLVWYGRFGPQISVPACSILFAELDLAADGRWIVEKGTLDVFLTNNKDIKMCPALQVDAYPGVQTCALLARDTKNDCLFCGESIPLNLMSGHVTNHVLDGDKVCDSKHSGDHAVCGFCGATNGICTVHLKGKKVSSTCPYAYAFKYASAVKKGVNVPKQCQVPLCVSSWEGSSTFPLAHLGVNVHVLDTTVQRCSN